MNSRDWEPITLDAFEPATLSDLEGLRLSVAGDPARTLGWWQTREALPPLPRGVWRVTLKVRYLEKAENRQYPELRMRAFRADNTFSAMSLSAHLLPDQRLPDQVSVHWESDGFSPWRLAVDLLSFAPNYGGGLEVTDVEAHWIGALP